MAGNSELSKIGKSSRTRFSSVSVSCKTSVSNDRVKCTACSQHATTDTPTHSHATPTSQQTLVHKYTANRHERPQRYATACMADSTACVCTLSDGGHSCRMSRSDCCLRSPSRNRWIKQHHTPSPMCPSASASLVSSEADLEPTKPLTRSTAGERGSAGSARRQPSGKNHLAASLTPLRNKLISV